MKAILEFNLPDDHIEYKHANKAVDYYLALGDIDHEIRNYLKYYDDKTVENAVTILESIRSRISEATIDSE